MTGSHIDKRDIDFVLHEQLALTALTEYEAYAGMTREDFDMILAESVRLCDQELAPINAQADAQGCRLENGRVTVPEAFVQAYKKYSEGGWVAPSMSPEMGGMGLPFAVALAISEMGIASCGSFMFYPGLTSSAGHVIENFASPELRDLVVPKLYSGEWTGTMCLTEPQAGTALADIHTTATPIEGTNEYLIKGNKIFISAGDHQLTDNIVHLVLARVPGDPQTTKGISLFVVPRERFDATGKITESNDVAVTAIEHKMGINGSSTCALSFGDNGQCRGYLVGEQRKGIVYMFQMMNEARIACGVQGVALGSSAYSKALGYAKERVQGAKVTDRSPDAKSVAIIEHPDVRRNLMLAKSYTEGCRALLYQAAIYADHAHHHPDEKVRTKYNDLMELLTPICKAYATDKGFKVTELAIQIHGGYGYIKEYGVEQDMRDSKIASIYEGTNGVQALDLLGRKMRMKGGGLFLTWLQETNNFLQANADHPRLSGLIAQVDKAKNKLAELVFGFMEMGKSDPEVLIQSATPFLETFGHVEVARLLAHQAIIADEKFQTLAAKKSAETPEALRALIEDNDDARFYDGKVKTAQFFASTTLPHVFALARSIKNKDRSALDIVF